MERQRRERLASHLDKEDAQGMRVFRLLLDKSIPPEKVLEVAQEIQPDTTPSEAERQQVVTVIEMLREMPVETALRNWRAYKQMAKALAPLLDNQSEAVRLLTEKPLASYGFAPRGASVGRANRSGQG
jgi:leucyl aminopeptidase (aminopeptidase T)